MRFVAGGGVVVVPHSNGRWGTPLLRQGHLKGLEGRGWWLALRGAMGSLWALAGLGTGRLSQHVVAGLREDKHILAVSRSSVSRVRMNACGCLFIRQSGGRSHSYLRRKHHEAYFYPPLIYHFRRAIDE